MADVRVRSYRGSDEGALLRLWNASLTHDPIAPATFRCKVLLDPNFDPQGLLVAEEDGELAGFLLSLVRRVPLPGGGLEPERSWITAFGIYPDRRRQGIGRALFNAALDRLWGLGCREVLVSPYVPHYFIPGVDVEAYPEAVVFLKALGFEVVSEPISMRAELTGFQIAPEIRQREAALRMMGIEVRPVESRDLPMLLSLIREHFGWDWLRFAGEYLSLYCGGEPQEVVFLVAGREEEIVGYCQARRERFGPFGARPDLRRRGIGRVLLFRCLWEMRARGFHCAWFLWTGEEAARLYRLAGFRTVRRFAVMRRASG